MDRNVDRAMFACVGVVVGVAMVGLFDVASGGAVMGARADKPEVGPTLVVVLAPVIESEPEPSDMGPSIAVPLPSVDCTNPIIAEAKPDSWACDGE